MKGMSIHINMFSILMIMHFLMGSIIPCYGENVSKEADMIQSDTLVLDTLTMPAQTISLLSDDYAVSMPSFPYKSPEASAFERYGSFLSGGYTGSNVVNIPLYTLSERGITIPVSLDYEASGIRVDQESTTVGLGWNLTAGGCISLTPSGQTDTNEGTGLWKDYQTAYNPDKAPSEASVLDKYAEYGCFAFENGYIPEDGTDYYTSVLTDLRRGLGERDIFSVVLPDGQSLKFFFNPYTCAFEVIGKVNGKYTIKAIDDNGPAVPSPCHERSIYSYSQGFEVRDGDGNIYTFTEKEYTYSGGISYPSAWNLTSIRNVSGDVIELKYTEAHDVSVIGKLSEEYLFISPANRCLVEEIGYGDMSTQTGYRCSYGGQIYKISKSYLKSMVSPRVRMDFGYTPGREDLCGALCLDTIRVTDNINGNVIKCYSLSHSYHIGSTVGGDYTQRHGYGVRGEDLDNVPTNLSLRLRLDSVEEQSSEGDKLTTTFHYDNTPLPLKTSYATDFWGYYNGQENITPESRIESYRTSIPEAKSIFLGNRSLINNATVSNFGGSIRFSDRRYTQASVLTGITYPTGGLTAFTYESNSFSSDDLAYPDVENYRRYFSTTSFLSSYTTDSIYIAMGARADDSNVDNPYLPQHNVVLVKVDISGTYTLTSFFRSKDGTLQDLDSPDVSVTLASHQNGITYNYHVSDAVSDDTNLSTLQTAETTSTLHLEAGWYTLVASLPARYGENSSCIVSAWLTSNLTAQEVKANIPESLQTSYGGGLRISAIDNYDNDGKTLLTHTTYTYEGGRLLIPSFYGDSWEKGMYSCVTTTPKAYLGYTISSSSLAYADAFTSSMAGGTVGYDKVTKDEYSADGRLIRRTETEYSNHPALEVLDNFCQFDEFSNGEVLSTTVSDTTGLKHTVTNTYIHEKTPFLCNIHLEDRSINDICSLQHEMAGGRNRRYRSTVYSYYRVWNRLKADSTATYEKNGIIATKHEYTYNPYNYKISSETYPSSDGGKYTTTYTYPCDLADDVSRLMTSENYITPTIRKTLEKDGTELRSTSTTYAHIAYPNGDHIFRPVFVSTSQDGGEEETRLEYTDYDELHQARTIRKDGMETVSYIYSYSSLYPIAEIKGATYAEMKSFLGTTTLENIENAPNPTRQDLEGLRTRLLPYSNPILMTGYLYKTGIGINTIMTSNGYVTEYLYDGFNRLSKSLDSEGKETSNVVYHYGEDGNKIETTVMLDATGGRKTFRTTLHDGLGRPVQIVTDALGESGRYTTTRMAYEGLETICREWLPVECGNDCRIMDEQEIETLADETYCDRMAYTTNHTDVLGRKEISIGPGQVWYASDKKVEKEYLVNKEREVKRYYAPDDGSYSLEQKGYYEPSTLRVTKTTDEDGRVSLVYTDMQERKILERRTDGTLDLDTYYIYDDKGNLRFVLSPEYQKSGYKAIFGYEYRYDNRGNILKKFLPQSSYVQYWYDSADRLKYMQDARMREKGLYRFFLYDNLSRPVVQGLCRTCKRDKSPVTATFNAQDSGFQGTGYTLSSETGIEDVELETINYYDRYTFMENRQIMLPDLLRQYCDTMAIGLTSQYEGHSQGMATATLVRTEAGEMLPEVYCYDDKGRHVLTLSLYPENRLLSETTTYTFTDNPETIHYTLFKSEERTDVLLKTGYTAYSDKPKEKRIKVWDNKGLNDEEKNLYVISYDNLGRIAGQSLCNGTDDVEYHYNIRGWMTSAKGRCFEERLTYETTPYGTPSYSGNISTQQWRTADDGILRGYQYTYDSFSRLTNALYAEGEAFSSHIDRYTESVPQYSMNGAIRKMIRHGLKQDGIYGKVDNLTISLDGNRLKKVTDDALPVLRNGATDFLDNKVNVTGAEYIYDCCGALEQDADRGITLIRYDNNSNPVSIQFADGSRTEYLYDTNGSKLRTIHRTAVEGLEVQMGEDMELQACQTVDADSTDYIGPFRMENGILDRFEYEGGYYSFPRETNSKGTICFFETDHLGNVRAVLDDEGRILQTTHYYPFGTPYADAGMKPSCQRRKYNGKELDNMHGLKTYDHGARQNYSVLGFWDRPDSKSEDYYNVSPYQYCHNNPVKYLDPDGKRIKTKYFTDNDCKYYNSPKQFANAMKAFAKTTYGKKILADFTPKGKYFFGVKGNGKYSKYDFVIEELDFSNPSEQASYFVTPDGEILGTSVLVNTDGMPSFYVSINVQKTEEELKETINHEFSIHLSQYEDIIKAYEKNKDYNDASDEWNSESAEEQHKDMKRIIPQKKGTKYYRTTQKELRYIDNKKRNYIKK